MKTRKEIEFHGEAHGRGKKATKLYVCWDNIRRKCRVVGCSAYLKRPKNECYAKRRLKMCKEWQESYIAFREWAYSHGFREDLTIDRIDNEKATRLRTAAGRHGANKTATGE